MKGCVLLYVIRRFWPDTSTTPDDLSEENQRYGLITTEIDVCSLFLRGHTAGNMSQSTGKNGSDTINSTGDYPFRPCVHHKLISMALLHIHIDDAQADLPRKTAFQVPKRVTAGMAYQVRLCHASLLIVEH